MGSDWTKEDSERLATEVRPIIVQVLCLDRDRLEGARKALDRQGQVMPFTDPTAWRDGMGEANDRALERLEALIDFYDRLAELGVDGDLPESLEKHLLDEQPEVLVDDD